MEITGDSPAVRRAPVRKSPAFRKPKRDFDQLDLIAPTFAELVPPEDPCRLVVALVGLLDVSALEGRLALVGAPSYPVKMLLALEMFARWDGEFGSRRVEKRCRYDVRYQFVCQGHRPDHSTIARFRRFLGEEIDGLLAESVRLGRRSGIVGSGRVGIDGTKLPAAASQWASYRRACEVADTEVAATPEEVVEEYRSRHRRDEVLPGIDPEARTLKTTRGEYLTGYNAQFAVDEAAIWSRPCM